MEDIDSSPDIFQVTKDPEKQKFRSSHTYTDIFNKIPYQNSFLNESNIFNQSNKEQFINRIDFSDIIKLKVILNYSYRQDYFEFNFPIKIFYNQERDKFQFSFNELINLISDYANDTSIFLNKNYGISYALNNPKSPGIDQKNRTYYFIGKFPLNDDIKYNIDVPLDGIIYIKLRKKISKIKSLRYEIFEDENEEELDEAEEKEKNEEKKEELKKEKSEKKLGKKREGKKDCKRSKEKRIGYIVKKVFEWKGLRRLSQEKMSLQDAAKNVGMSKKSLDEYYNQIKEGKKYGFDFHKYKRDKVNVLRGFVKKKKADEPKENKRKRKNQKKEEKKEKEKK